jgi:hypothetical protein
LPPTIWTGLLSDRNASSLPGAFFEAALSHFNGEDEEKMKTRVPDAAQ